MHLSIKIELLHELTGLDPIFHLAESAPTFAAFAERNLVYKWVRVEFFGGGTEPIKNGAQDTLPFNSYTRAVRFE